MNEYWYIGKDSAIDILDPGFVLSSFHSRIVRLILVSLQHISGSLLVFVIRITMLRDEIHGCRTVIYITALCKN